MKSLPSLAVFDHDVHVLQQVEPAINSCRADAGMITVSISGGYVLSQCA